MSLPRARLTYQNRPVIQDALERLLLRGAGIKSTWSERPDNAVARTFSQSHREQREDPRASDSERSFHNKVQWFLPLKIEGGGCGSAPYGGCKAPSASSIRIDSAVAGIRAKNLSHSCRHADSGFGPERRIWSGFRNLPDCAFSFRKRKSRGTHCLWNLRHYPCLELINQRSRRRPLWVDVQIIGYNIRRCFRADLPGWRDFHRNFSQAL